MARPKKVSSRVNKPRDSRPLRELREDLPFEEPDWQEFLRHVLDGFTDYEKAHGPGDYDTRLRLSDVPDSWFEGIDPLGYVTLRVLKEARPEIAVPVAYYFVQVGLPEPGEWEVPPGLGPSWLYLARQEAECPVDTRELAQLALRFPDAFFRGVEDEDVVLLGRLILEALKPITVSDLHALMTAVRRARPGERTIFHLFKDLMSWGQIPTEIKAEICRGVLECPDAVRDMAERAAALRSDLAAKVPMTDPLAYLAIESPVFYKLHAGLKRHAVVALVETVGEPLRDVIDAYFLKSTGHQAADIATSEGAIDLIRDHAGELEDDTVKRLLGRAIKSSWAPVREAAYRAGAERFGLDYARPALKDPTNQVRNWAQKYLAAGKPKRAPRSRAKPE